MSFKFVFPSYKSIYIIYIQVETPLIFIIKVHVFALPLLCHICFWHLQWYVIGLNLLHIHLGLTIPIWKDKKGVGVIGLTYSFCSSLLMHTFFLMSSGKKKIPLL